MKQQHRETPFYLLCSIAIAIVAGGLMIAWIVEDRARLEKDNAGLCHQIEVERAKRNNLRDEYEQHVESLRDELKSLRTIEYTVQARPPEQFDDADERIAAAYDKAVQVVGGSAALGESKRSPHWPAVRNKFAAEHPECAVCGAKTQVVHHVETFAEHPEKELDPNNLEAFCDRCHLLVGHLGNFQNVNAEVRKHIKILHDAKVKADEVRMAKQSAKTTMTP